MLAGTNCQCLKVSVKCPTYLIEVRDRSLLSSGNLADLLDGLDLLLLDSLGTSGVLSFSSEGHLSLFAFLGGMIARERRKER